MTLRNIIFFCCTLFINCTPTYAFHLWSGCDYDRTFDISLAQLNPMHPRPALKMMTPLNDGLGSGFVYVSTSSTGSHITILAHCWTFPIFQWELPEQVSHDGDNHNGSVKLTLGSSSNPKDQIELVFDVHLPLLFGNFKTSITSPTANASYKLAIPIKNASGENGRQTVIIQAS